MDYRLARYAWEAECKVGTYVSVSNKGASDLAAHINSAKHKTAATGERYAAKFTDCLMRPDKTAGAVTAEEGVLVFNTTKHVSSYRSMDCTPALLKKGFS